MACEERAHLISRRQLGILLGIMSCAPSLLRAAQLSEKPKKSQTPFLVYYGASTDPAIGAFALAALDSDLNLAPLDQFRRDATYLGYLSLSEVHSGRPYFAELAAEGLLVGANANWPDARFIDLRHENWRRRVVKDLIPGILQKGFDGVFLDTLRLGRIPREAGPEPLWRNGRGRCRSRPRYSDGLSGHSDHDKPGLCGTPADRGSF